MEKIAKVLFISNIPSPYKNDLIEYLQQNISEYNFFVLYTNSNEDNRKWKTKKIKNCTILNSKIIKIKGKNDNRYIHLPSKFSYTLNSINPDILIVDEYNYAALISMFWAKSHKKKFIHLTEGTLNSEKNISLIQKLLRKFIISKSDSYIAASTKSKEKLEYWGANKNKIFVCYLTVNQNCFINTLKHTKNNVILYVGSLINRKGLDLLLYALANVKHKYEMHIVGCNFDDNYYELLELSKKLNISDKIKWIGFIEGKELYKEYEQANLFVFPSREDCFGLVLVEALFSNIPIVSSCYADASYDVVKQGYNGFIVNPYDAKIFSEKIDKVLDNGIFLNNASIINKNKFYYGEISKNYKNAIDATINENF